MTHIRLKRPVSAALRGFTLIEALVTVSVLIVVVAIATPSLSEFLAKQDVRAVSQFGFKAFSTARTQALTINAASTYVCWNLTDADIFITDTDSNQQLQPNKIVVLTGTAADFDEVITMGQIRSDTTVVFDNDNDNCIEFDAQGRLVGSTNPALFGMTFCQATNDVTEARRVEVNAAGRVSVKLNSDASGMGVQTCN